MDRVFEIIPYVSVNTMKFGDNRQQIRSALGSPNAEMMIGYPVSDHYSDDYGYIIVKVPFWSEIM